MACEEAAAAPLVEHGDVARRVAGQVLGVAGWRAQVGSVVYRAQGALHAEVTIPAGATNLAGTIAARVTSALRAHDRSAAAIDVAVAESSTELPSESPADGGRR